MRPPRYLSQRDRRRTFFRKAQLPKSTKKPVNQGAVQTIFGSSDLLRLLFAFACYHDTEWITLQQVNRHSYSLAPQCTQLVWFQDVYLGMPKDLVYRFQFKKDVSLGLVAAFPRVCAIQCTKGRHFYDFDFVASSYQKLEFLSLSHCRLDSLDCEVIATLPCLRHIQFWEVRFPPYDLLTCPTLRILELTSCDLRHTLPQRAHSLETVILHEMDLPLPESSGWDLFKTLCNDVKNLSITVDSFSSTAVDFLPNFPLPNLTSLTLTYTSYSLEYINEASHLVHLTLDMKLWNLLDSDTDNLYSQLLQCWQEISSLQVIELDWGLKVGKRTVITREMDKSLWLRDMPC